MLKRTFLCIGLHQVAYCSSIYSPVDTFTELQCTDPNTSEIYPCFTRISLPLYDESLYSMFNGTAQSLLYCDYPSLKLSKVWRASMIDTDPRVDYLMNQFQILTPDINWMFANLSAQTVTDYRVICISIILNIVFCVASSL